MKSNFNTRLKKLILLLLLGFVVLFIFRLAHGYTLEVDTNSARVETWGNRMSSFKNNYASKKYEVKSANATQSSVKIDQKYEKVANISTKSTAFEEEEQRVRQEIEKYKSLIQFEQKSGNRGNRRLDLRIGVPPENFDALYQNLTTIGVVQSKQITKKDKTNEYKELNAKKASLEKIRSSLIELKSKGGKIEEYMQLENRILEIEQQLQGLGVSLGDFDDENEFCTVQFSLQEWKKTQISLLHRLKVAFEWTVKYYLMMMTSLFFLSFFAYFVLTIIDKLKIFERLIDKREK